MSISKVRLAIFSYAQLDCRETVELNSQMTLEKTRLVEADSRKTVSYNFLQPSRYSKFCRRIIDLV